MNIVSFSGGKDSTATLLMLIEAGEQIDKILFFDAGTWEFPQMREHVAKVEKNIGREITRIGPPNSFDYWAFEHVLTKGKNAGTIGYGFPSSSRRWCTKIKTTEIDKHSSPDDTVFMGFAADEVKRVHKKNIAEKKYSVRFPLVEAGMTEREALRFCYERGFDWGGLYNHFSRVSCWCCPLQNDRELYQLYLHFPDLWQRLKDMQDRSWNSFRMDYTRIEDYEKIFKVKETQLELCLSQGKGE